MSTGDNPDNPYKEVVELIKHWESFRKSFPDGSIAEFGRWLTFNAPARGYAVPDETEHGKRKSIPARSRMPMMSKKAMAGAILGRMTLFVKNYAKVPFQEIGLGSMEEFKILSMIGRMKNPSKSMLSHESLMEFTTINDMLKRLQKKGWIRQLKDEDDKRLSRVMLTESGQQFMQQVYKTMSNIQPSLLGDLNEEEQDQLIRLLIRLNDFHTHYYDQHYKK